MVSHTAHTVEDLTTVAEQIVGVLIQNNAHVLTLQGDLGAGKTALTKALAQYLGVTEEVTSPTFVIMKSYPVSHPHFTTLTHIDAYRIESEDELAVLGLPERLKNPTELFAIEWPERIPGVIPESALRLSISIGEGDERTITYAED